MKLKPNGVSETALIDPKAGRLQRHVDLRRRYLRALIEWSNYESSGVSISLAECCRKYGVSPNVGYALRRDEKVMALVDRVTSENARQGLVMSENMMLKRMKEAGQIVVVETEEGDRIAMEKNPMRDSDMAAFAGHFRRVDGGGFEKKDLAPSVLVQVNLPQPASYSAEARAEARVIAEDEFGDLLKHGANVEDDADHTPK